VPYSLLPYLAFCTMPVLEFRHIAVIVLTVLTTSFFLLSYKVQYAKNLVEGVSDAPNLPTPCASSSNKVKDTAWESPLATCSSLRPHNVEVLGIDRQRFVDREAVVYIATDGSVNGTRVDQDFLQTSVKWFKGTLPRWEVLTFAIFRALIKSDMVYVGFGEWIGPTMLYAGQLAKSSHVFEPDILAFRTLALNAQANHCFGDRVHLHYNCIDSANHEMAVVGKSGKLGTSESSMAELKQGQEVAISETITCWTLETFLSQQGLMDERLFVKIDTEGGETRIVPTLIPLVKKLRIKPTFFISKHRHSGFDDPAVKKAFLDLAALYKCAKIVTDNLYSRGNPRARVGGKSVMSMPNISIPWLDTSAYGIDILLVDQDCEVVSTWFEDVKKHFM
jgi:FkbM family methyltransferase